MQVCDNSLLPSEGYVLSLPFFNSQRAIQYDVGLLYSLKVSYVVFSYAPNL